MLSAMQIDRFAREGAVTLDTPFTEDLVEAAAAELDRLCPYIPDPARGDNAFRVQRSNDYHEPALLELIQHPFLEQVARRILGAEAVDFFATAIAKTYPQPGEAFRFWEHVDIKYATTDLDAVPRRMVCSCLVWLTDVTPDRAPLMYRPGSHRQIAAAMDRRPEYIDNPQNFEHLPRLDYAAPVPLLARKGQLTACTTSTVHGASNCTGTQPRKVLFATFVPKGFEIRANMASVNKRQKYVESLRPRLRPERRHILPDPVPA
ncbi:MAG: phytanoyl-CoA dioxygenase family protein [Planctomycetota bacterium]|nr:phytanoyl-CoA dioxygenase family protein [Planctomycetota bacterium]